ncbi:MAG: hypothetical protein EBZ00_03410 [Actinobacteria bacterium]|nr:hypothetical protein [Actinomycetota bacterium]
MIIVLDPRGERDEGETMKKRIKSVIAGTAIAGIMATAAFGLAGHAGARPKVRLVGLESTQLHRCWG